MKKIAIVAVLIIIPILVAFISFGYLFNPISDSDPFYVGVTYCGSSVEEAKQLIDRVKDYTNLFVLQSGKIQYQPEQINEICEYAVDSGLHFILYFGTVSGCNVWYDEYDSRWDNYFLGVYLGDEPAGKMLEGERSFWDYDTNSSIKKMADGRIIKMFDNSTCTYFPDGRIELSIFDLAESPKLNELDARLVGAFKLFSYFPNGTVVAQISENIGEPLQIVEEYDLPYSYEELLELRPFQTYDEAAKRFIEYQESCLKMGLKEVEFNTFTSDYLLYWFDYFAGYDVVLAQFGWNHTLTQDIALVRGAANLQKKDWGAIITWKYNQPPYLDTGEAIYDQMKTAYGSGAKYVIIFNYAENMTEAHGTLQEEHFVALENFWNEVVENPEIKQGSVKADAVLVLPENYGWGMRRPDDKIWGLWGPDEKSVQIWSTSQSLLKQYGLNLDLIYEDQQFPVEEKYSNIFYWNQK